MPLTDAAIRNAKPGPTVRKLSDGEGLQLWVTPSGSKLWRLAYRHGGKQKKLAIGEYPEISLLAARERRSEAKKLLAKDIDPGQQKRVEKLTRAKSEAATFAVLADELVAKKRAEGKAATTIDKVAWILGFAKADFGHRPVAEVTPAEVLATLRKIEGAGRRETAKRLRAVAGEVFRFAIATGRAENDPTVALRGALAAVVVKHRSAILDPIALGGLLRAIEGFNGQPTTVAALKLLALLFPRPGELRGAEWREFDLEAGVWTIPAARTKMRREHRVPLPAQAAAILAQLHALTGHGALVFPGVGQSGGAGRRIAPRPISEGTLNAALRRLGYGPDVMTPHGFRATASTLLNESGLFSPDAIERALAHKDADGVRAAYARGPYWDERVRMAEWWADRLDALREGGKVLPFGRVG